MSTPSLTKFLLDKKPLIIGVHPHALALRSATRTTLQWIVHDPAALAAATIDLYVATTDRHEDLLDVVPATNPYWSPLEDNTGAVLTFPHLPGAVIGSCILPLDVSLTAILAVITVAGGPYPSFSLLARTTG